MYDIAFILQVNHKESDNFAIDFFQMLKSPESLHSLHVLHFICTFFVVLVNYNLKDDNDVV